jgi:hypothetical protein
VSTRSTRSRRARLAAALCAPLALAALATVAACAGAPRPAAAPNSAASTAAGRSPSASASPSNPTGTALKALLVTGFPKSFAPIASGTVDSGNDVQYPGIAPVPAKPDCAKLGGTGFVAATGVKSVAFAQSDYADRAHNEVAQEISSYASVDAQVAMARLRDQLAACAAFPLTVGKVVGTLHVTMTTVPKLGDEALVARFTAKEFLGGTTIIAARVGNTIVSTLYNDTVGAYDDGHLINLAVRLVSNVRAAS